jgi:hypothetical protein
MNTDALDVHAHLRVVKPCHRRWTDGRARWMSDRTEYIGSRHKTPNVCASRHEKGMELRCRHWHMEMISQHTAVYICHMQHSPHQCSLPCTQNRPCHMPAYDNVTLCQPPRHSYPASTQLHATVASPQEATARIIVLVQAHACPMPQCLRTCQIIQCTHQTSFCSAIPKGSAKRQCKAVLAAST